MKRASSVWLVLIGWVLAFEWLHSGWAKWSTSAFITNVGKTLEAFASKTPYTAYANFLKTTVIPNAEVFGNMIRSGEILVGLALALGGLLLLIQKRLPVAVSMLVGIASFGGALMNLNFFLSAGWSSPSTWGVNVVMGLIHLLLGLYFITNRKELAS